MPTNMMSLFISLRFIDWLKIILLYKKCKKYSDEERHKINWVITFFAQAVHNLRRQKFLLRIKETTNNIWPGKH